MPSCYQIDLQHLELLKDLGEISQYELKDDMLKLYIDELKPGEDKRISIQRGIKFKGQCHQKPSVIYSYFDQENKVWV